MGLAAVKGFQGDLSKGLSDKNVLVTLKHFVAHGEPENGTNGGPVKVSDRVLREVFLFPFQKAIEASAESVMASYNEVDGVPSHANKWLLQDVLRKEWGFKGTVVSDYYGIEELNIRHILTKESLLMAKFELSNPILKNSTINKGNTATVSVTIKNTGYVAAAEVVQLYIHDEKCSVTRPIKELKSFFKVFLKPGEPNKLNSYYPRTPLHIGTLI